MQWTSVRRFRLSASVPIFPPEPWHRLELLEDQFPDLDLGERRNASFNYPFCSRPAMRTNLRAFLWYRQPLVGAQPNALECVIAETQTPPPRRGTPSAKSLSRFAHTPPEISPTDLPSDTPLKVAYAASHINLENAMKLLGLLRTSSRIPCHFGHGEGGGTSSNASVAGSAGRVFKRLKVAPLPDPF